MGCGGRPRAGPRQGPESIGSAEAGGNWGRQNTSPKCQSCSPAQSRFIAPCAWEAFGAWQHATSPATSHPNARALSSRAASTSSTRFACQSLVDLFQLVCGFAEAFLYLFSCRRSHPSQCQVKQRLVRLPAIRNGAVNGPGFAEASCSLEASRRQDAVLVEQSATATGSLKDQALILNLVPKVSGCPSPCRAVAALSGPPVPTIEAEVAGHLQREILITSHAHLRPTIRLDFDSDRLRRP